jgi:hypothetical protein
MEGGDAPLAFWNTIIILRTLKINWPSVKELGQLSRYSDCVMGWTTEEWKFYFYSKKEIFFLYSTASKPALGTKKIPTLSVRGSFHQE